MRLIRIADLPDGAGPRTREWWCTTPRCRGVRPSKPPTSRPARAASGKVGRADRILITCDNDFD